MGDLLERQHRTKTRAAFRRAGAGPSAARAGDARKKGARPGTGNARQAWYYKRFNV
ncbi:hypothetical protein LFL97_35495 [Burkholderia sp. JSH-S8]|nr:hypothetical protein LFL97_35495 [Burkholderia sp. JSH-S8]